MSFRRLRNLVVCLHVSTDAVPRSSVRHNVRTALKLPGSFVTEEDRSRHAIPQILPMGGIYRCDAVQQDVIATGQGFGAKCAVFVVNETGITTKAAFLDKIAAVMAFPDYFGRNWDALNDCLTDPPAAPASGTILILENCDEFARHEPDEWHTAVAVFASAAETRKRMSTPLYVLISHGCPPVASARPLPCEGFPQETVQLHVEMFTMRSEPND